MTSPLLHAVQAKDSARVESLLPSLQDTGNWSLISCIDELLPAMLGETNLNYKNFHLVKQGLFLRKLAKEGYFSAPTEYALGRLLSLEMVHRYWVYLSAEVPDVKKHHTESLQSGLLDALEQQNSHNALYYASALLEHDADRTVQTLLSLAALSIPNTLGHSVSCFFPVYEDLIHARHPHAVTALLSVLMYLCRDKHSRATLQKVEAKGQRLDEYGTLLKRCASGSGIINLHHMITFYTLTAWEEAGFNAERIAPLGILTDWIEGKQIDRQQEEGVSTSLHADDLPHSYEDFVELFSFERLDDTIAAIFMLVEIFPKRAVDWLFRIYASHYTPGSWDPHYYTSLYAALRLCEDERITDNVASRMALAQAIRYFAEGR